MKKICLLSVIALCGWFCLSAQQQAPFYYYKGEPVTIPVNSQHFLIYADAGEISIEDLADIYKVTEWIESGENDIIEVQVIIPNNNYDSVISFLKTKDYIIDIEPVIGDSVLTNTSRLFYVKLQNVQDYPLLSDLALRTGVEIRGEVSYCENWYELSVNKNSVGNSIAAANIFWETLYFENIDPGFIIHVEPTSVTTCVSDPRFDEQWGLQAIKACSAWKITKGDTNVRVAVIDGGIDTIHSEFDSSHVVFSYDIEMNSSPAHAYCKEPNRDNNNPDPHSCFFHGLHVGGIIFANHNSDSIAGVAPKTSMINISSLFNTNDSLPIKLAQAINLSLSYEAKVINNSWGDAGGTFTLLHCTMLEEAIDNAIDSGCVVVFSAGNNDNDSVNYPASYRPEILVVSSISQNYFLQGCANYNKGLDVVAPGAEILSTHKYISTHNEYGYLESTGTSMAAPHVSGVAGLMFSINPELTGEDVRDIIEQTAQKIPNYNFDSIAENGTWDEFVGYGLLDAHRAVLKAAYHKVYGDTSLTLCDTNRHIYTVHTPYNANIDSVTFFWTCSDNLQMIVGQTTDSVWVKRVNGGTSHLQCHIIHDGDTVVSTLDIPIISGTTVYDNLSLNSGISFPDTFVLSREIVIDSLTTLFWQNKTALCTPDCRIIVRPGALMMLNHTTLTSACPNRMWQGIDVVGNCTEQQMPQNQGILYVENGSVVENAFTAVRNCLASDPMTTGGVIHAFSSTFRNNCRTVNYNPYTYSPYPGYVPVYASSFKKCTFTVNDQNLFAANDTVFTEHVKMWGVNGIHFEGCSFYDSTSVPASGRRGIYTENAGLILDTYCDVAYSDCECPESHATYSSFSGFNTAIEVNTTGDQFPVTVNETRFSNNVNGIRINGNQLATVTRNIFNLNESPFAAIYVVGLDLNNSTGYKVEENTFLKASNLFIGTTKGITVCNSTTSNNTIYRNSFQGLDYGIFVTMTNGNSRKGLQILCNTFLANGTDFFVDHYSTVSPFQGTSQNSAGNTFDKKTGLDIVNNGSQNLNYYYTGNTLSPYYPDQCSGLVTKLSASKTNPCTSTLCNNNGSGGTQKTLPEFQSEMAEADNDSPQLDMQQSLSDTYHAAVRAIMADSLLDLSALEQWHAAAQSIGDPYSLTETRFMMGYNEPFVADADDAELANYAEFHAMKVALRNAGVCDTPQQDGHINWYALTPAQIAQLQVIAERNAGRASVMAKGVLCFFHGICYDDDSFVDDNVDNNDNNMETRSAKASPQDGETRLNVYPNPTDDLLLIELAGGEIANVALHDLQGRVVAGAGAYAGAPQPGTTATMNMRNVPAGVYLLRVTDADGKEYHRKIVKR